MSGNTSTLTNSPVALQAGSYSAQQLRNLVACATADMQGLISRGDFAVTQRAAGANMSVDIAAGRALVVPASVTYQSGYMCQNDSSYNTSSNGGYTWTAADGSNPRIDLVCIEVKDNAHDAGGINGFRFRIVDGTPNASATHQLETAYWPAVPSGCLPIAAIRIPAGDTTISTTDITNLNPIAGGRPVTNYVATEESSSGTGMGRLVSTAGTADFTMMYVPSAQSVVELAYRSLAKASTAVGNHDFAVYINGTQLKIPVLRAAPIASVSRFTLGTKYTQVASDAGVAAGGVNATAGLFTTVADSTTDQTFESSPAVFASALATTASGRYQPWIPISGITAGWNVFEVRYQMSANTLSCKNRTTITRLAA